MVGDRLTNESQALPTVVRIGDPTICSSASGSLRTSETKGRGYRLGTLIPTICLPGFGMTKLGLEVSDAGWDSEMVCYPHVFERDGRIHLLYNGNEFGSMASAWRSWNDLPSTIRRSVRVMREHSRSPAALRRPFIRRFPPSKHSRLYAQARCDASGPLKPGTSDPGGCRGRLREQSGGASDSFQRQRVAGIAGLGMACSLLRTCIRLAQVLNCTNSG